jgi:hypothetical protein
MSTQWLQGQIERLLKNAEEANRIIEAKALLGELS